MSKAIHYAASKDPQTSKLLDKIGTGIHQARSADLLISSCGFSGEDELNAAIASAWAHKKYVLQYKGKFFLAADADELAKYITRQCDADGNPVIEYR